MFLLLVGMYDVWPEFLHNQLVLSLEDVLGTVPYRNNGGGSVYGVGKLYILVQDGSILGSNQTCASEGRVE